MKITALCIILALLAQAAIAQTTAAEEETSGGIESAPGLVLLVTTEPGVRLDFNWKFVVPFLQGDGPLTKDNNLAITPGVEITPAALSLTANAVWTPIAFAEIVAGGRVGSGWSLGKIRGIGLNLPDVDGASKYDGSAFDGALWGLRAGAALQGDLAAFFPGEWNSVVFRSFHGISYSAYSRAKNGQAWFIDNDEGENRNGSSYNGNFLLGYRMPIFLNMVALLAEADLFLNVMDGGAAFGDDLARWTFSGILGFKVSERLGVTLLTQLRTHRNFTNGNWQDLHFSRRTLDTSNRLRLEFYRVVAVLDYKF